MELKEKELKEKESRLKNFVLTDWPQYMWHRKTVNVLNICHSDSVLMVFYRVIKLNFLNQGMVFSDVNYTEKYKYVYPDYISLIQTLIYGLCCCILKHKSTTGIC